MVDVVEDVGAAEPDEEGDPGACTLIVTWAVAVDPFGPVTLTEIVCEPEIENDVEVVGVVPVFVAKLPLPSRSH